MTKVFVDWPIYSPASNGIRCLYELSLELYNQGIDVMGVPRNIKNHFRSIELLPRQFRSIPITKEPHGSRQDILIASETIPQSVITKARHRQLRIAWWQLAPFGLLGSKNFPLPGDINMPYSSYTDPGSNYFFYYQPPLESEWEEALLNPIAEAGHQKRLLIYNGKGRLTPLPQKILVACKQSRIQLVTRFNPETKKDLFHALTTSHGLISFDELTNLNLEAASLGVPIFLANPVFSPISRSRFSVKKFSKLSTNDPSEFIHLLDARRAGDLERFNIHDLTASNYKTLRSILSIIRHADNERFIVKESDIRRYHEHTEYLTLKRAIYVHAGGQSGGAALSNIYCQHISKGCLPPILHLGIRLMDSLYRYCGFFLNPANNIRRRIAIKLGLRRPTSGLLFEKGKRIHPRSQPQRAS